MPINVTLLFSREQYLAAAEAYLRGIERRIAAGLDPKVESVASLFVSRWDVAIKDQVPPEQRNRLGIAIAQRTYKAYRELLASPRWQKLAAAGAHPQRMLWASTGTKDPAAPDTLYVEALAAPDTVDTIPDKTLLAFADHGKLGGAMPLDGGDAEAVIAEFGRQGIDDAALAARLQQEGADAFAKSWASLLAGIATRRAMAARRARMSGPAWAWRVAGATAHQTVGRRHLRELFASDARRGERLGLEAAGCTSTIRRTASTTRRCGCCSPWPPSAACASAPRRCFAATSSTPPRSARCCTSRCARPRARR